MPFLLKYKGEKLYIYGQLKNNQRLQEFATLSIRLNIPYVVDDIGLQRIGSAPLLKKHGVINPEIISGYFDIFKEINNILSSQGFDCYKSGKIKNKQVVISLKNTRKGSVYFDIALMWLEGTLTIAGIYTLIREVYNKLKQWISKKNKTEGLTDQSIILNSSIKEELKRLKNK